MSERLDKLVTLYAKQSVDEINNDPTLLEQSFGKSHDELAQEWGFSEEQLSVSELKLWIESHRAELTTSDNARQIAECLKMVLNVAMNTPEKTRDSKMNITANLFEQMFSACWSGPQKVHFGFVKEKIKRWHSYFISYTNDGAKVTNAKYQSVIDVYVDTDVIERKRDKENLLVEAIVNLLRTRLPSRSFYDKQNIKLGDDLNLHIGPACKNTFAFVQLVQLDAFNPLQDLNWCFEEYQQFLKGNEQDVKAHVQYRDVFRQRFCAILAGDKRADVCPSPPPWKYEPWINRIFQQQHYVPLPKDPKEFDVTIMELVDGLFHVHNQIIENVPP